MPRPRFSLRGLLLLTACLAAFCYWRDRPRRIANQFAELIQAENFEAAEKMYTPPGQPRRVGFGPAGDWRVVRKPQSARDWLAGRYYVTVTSKVFSRGHSFAWPMLVTGDDISLIEDRQVVDGSGQVLRRGW
jgi:hypothetical protein